MTFVAVGANRHGFVMLDAFGSCESCGRTVGFKHDPSSPDCITIRSTDTIKITASTEPLADRYPKGPITIIGAPFESRGEVRQAEPSTEPCNCESCKAGRLDARRQRHRIVTYPDTWPQQRALREMTRIREMYPNYTMRPGKGCEHGCLIITFKNGDFDAHIMPLPWPPE